MSEILFGDAPKLGAYDIRGHLSGISSNVVLIFTGSLRADFKSSLPLGE
jgi:hypothetical protein